MTKQSQNQNDGTDLDDSRDPAEVGREVTEDQRAKQRDVGRVVEDPQTGQGGDDTQAPTAHRAGEDVKRGGSQRQRQQGRESFSEDD